MVLSKDEHNQKIFKVTRIPKVAFAMVPREVLTRTTSIHVEDEDESSDDQKGDKFDERKNAFGNKRDDLFYKTIGRDVRKYIQELFQIYIGEHIFKDLQKHGTFLKKFKDFYAEVIEPKLASFSNPQKMFS